MRSWTGLDAGGALAGFGLVVADFGLKAGNEASDFFGFADSTLQVLDFEAEFVGL